MFRHQFVSDAGVGPQARLAEESGVQHGSCYLFAGLPQLRYGLGSLPCMAVVRVGGSGQCLVEPEGIVAFSSTSVEAFMLCISGFAILGSYPIVSLSSGPLQVQTSFTY